MLGRNRMASGQEEAFKACATKRAVFCWQCFSDLGLALIVYLRCLCQRRQFGWHRMVPFVGLGHSAHLPYYGVLLSCSPF